jgi:hypothetical protein
MTKPESETQLQIGMLVLEQNALDKKIGKLRDEISQRATIFARVGRLLVFHPERVVFEGQTVDDEQFAGEPVIDRKAMDVDSLIAELRAAIVRKRACTAQLAELGIDLEEIERDQNLRASRALFHPAAVRYGPEDGGAKREEKPEDKRQDKRADLGFTKPRRKSGS